MTCLATPDPKPGDIIDGAMSITQLMNKPFLVFLKLKDMVTGNLKKKYIQQGLLVNE